MSLLSIRSVPERCLWAALIFSTISQAYRYPLKISDSGTSPTYADTPLPLQLPKYVVILLLCSIACIYSLRQRMMFRKWHVGTIVVLLSAYSIFKAVVGMEADRAAYLEAAFWPLASIMLAFAVRRVSVEAVIVFFKFLLIFALTSNAIEVLLFFTTGRLPALAYPGSFSVRFGGFLDDPNGFASLLYLLMGWCHHHFVGVRRVAIQGVLVLCIILTQSLTAIGFLLMLTACFIGYRFLRRPKPILFLGIGALLFAVLSYTWKDIQQVVQSVLEARSGSVNEHFSQVTLGALISGWDLVGGGLTYLHYESWWVASLFTFGLLWWTAFLLIVIMLIVAQMQALRRTIDPASRSVLTGLCLFSSYVAVGDLNLPLFTVFPVNFFFFLFSFLVLFERLVPRQALLPHLALVEDREQV